MNMLQNLRLRHQHLMWILRRLSIWLWIWARAGGMRKGGSYLHLCHRLQVVWASHLRVAVCGIIFSSRDVYREMFRPSQIEERGPWRPLPGLRLVRESTAHYRHRSTRHKMANINTISLHLHWRGQRRRKMPSNLWPNTDGYCNTCHLWNHRH